MQYQVCHNSVELLSGGEAQTVSLSQLKNLSYGDLVETERFRENVSIAESAPKLYRIRVNPTLPKSHPFDFWQARRERQADKYLFIESWRPVELLAWESYVRTLGIQTNPREYLDYLRCCISAGPNPWVELVDNTTSLARFAYQYGPGDRTKLPINPYTSEGYLWANQVTGDKYSVGSVIPAAMIPHTVDANGDMDFSPTIDRYTETIISSALFDSFTILDITRTNDAEKLQWAYSRVLNFLPYAKSLINETSVITTRNSGDTRRYSYELPASIKNMLKAAADDATVIIRQNIDKLAARTLEVLDIERSGESAPFIGPDWLNPINQHSGFHTDTPRPTNGKIATKKPNTTAAIGAGIAAGLALALSMR